MTMPWENQDNNNESWDNNNEPWDNNNNDPWNNNEGDNNEGSSYGDDNSHQDDSIEEIFSSHENNEEESAQDDEQQPTLDDVEDELKNVPKRSQGTPQFSERDVYQIVNLNTVLNVLDEEQRSWVDTIFGAGGSGSNDIKRAIRIVSMDSTEIGDKIKPVEALRSLRDVTEETDPTKIIDNLLSGIRIVEDLSTADKAALISLLRKIAKNHPSEDGKTMNIRVTRNSSGAEIIDAMRNLMKSYPAVKGSIESLTQCVEIIETALK